MGCCLISSHVHRIGVPFKAQGLASASGEAHGAMLNTPTPRSAQKFDPSVTRQPFPANTGWCNLSFAKTTSAFMWLRCNAFITMMETAKLWDVDDVSDTRHRSRTGALLVQSQRGPGLMVGVEIRSERPLEITGAQDDKVVQAVSPYGSD